jgi:hypothetical protein
VSLDPTDPVRTNEVRVLDRRLALSAMPRLPPVLRKLPVKPELVFCFLFALEFEMVLNGFLTEDVDD